MSSYVDFNSIERLVEASDYRSFIKILIEEKSKQKRFGYADIARLGGFAARSFPRDVVMGAKKISLQSLPKMIRGLGLQSDLAEYFRMMVEIEEPECRMKMTDEFKLLQMKANLKKRIFKKRKNSVGDSDKAFVLSNIPKIYAALGPCGAGAQIKDIQEKTKIAPSEIMKSLELMVQNNMVEKKGKYFLAIENHANYQGLNSEIFKKHFVRSAEESIAMASRFMGSQEKLFLSSAFSVREKDLGSLKEELRSLLLKYVDSSENPYGDRVINLVASLF